MTKKQISAADINARLDFSGGDLGTSQAMVTLQEEGVAALCNILAEHPVAYLADEVGLGKTMQTLGVIAWHQHENPDARILVISPRTNVQKGWQKESKLFDARMRRVARHAVNPSQESLKFCDNLREWLLDVDNNNVVHLLRHSSFMRPVCVDSEAVRSWEDVLTGLKVPDSLRDMLRNQAPPTNGHSNESNMAFARGVNAWLRDKGIRFDLVVVDEAQCLRNIDNQTNQVLKEMLGSVTDKWLFLSATPAHSGVNNIKQLFHHYPDVQDGELIPMKAFDGSANLPTLREHLRKYMIRRPRTYVIGDKAIGKHDYRHDDPKSLALSCRSVLHTLSIALVQQRLVNTLEKENNRLRSGFLASYESLENTRLANEKAANKADAKASNRVGNRVGNKAGIKATAKKTVNGINSWNAEDEHNGELDFYHERHTVRKEAHVPDSDIVNTLTSEFAARFGISLPHPKLDEVERTLAETALGDRTAKRPGGIKTLVFCRRLSSVEQLRKRLTRCYLDAIDARCEMVWERKLNWETGQLGNAPPSAEIDNEDDDSSPRDDDHDDDNRLRIAQRPGKWLNRFSATFYDGARNALALEENWFAIICKARSLDLQEAAARIPDSSWYAAYKHAFDGNKRHRQRQFHFLLWHCLDDPEQKVLRLSAEDAVQWRTALEHLRPDVTRKKSSSDESFTSTNVHRDESLMTFSSFWSTAETGLHGSQLLLPAHSLPAALTAKNIDDIRWRQSIINVLDQYLRRTDTLVDLYCADRRASDKSSTMQTHFLSWLNSDDIDAQRLRSIWHEWAQRYRLIFSSALGVPGSALDALKFAHNPDFLTSLNAVVGVTGGSKGNSRAIQQFNTPGMPWVMVGTDTIREGVNLHLFCDRVMHYGTAWTAGDLEQRIGRVDRYFSQIERRLQLNTTNPGEATTLDIFYPHLRDTVERRQIEAIMYRKRLADRVVSDGIEHAAADGETITFDVDERYPLATVPESIVPARQDAEPFFGARQHLPPTK